MKLRVQLLPEFIKNIKFTITGLDLHRIVLSLGHESRCDFSRKTGISVADFLGLYAPELSPSASDE